MGLVLGDDVNDTIRDLPTKAKATHAILLIGLLETETLASESKSSLT